MHGPRAGVLSGDARAACRGETPGRRRRALAERSGDGPARPTLEGHAESEEQILQESVQRAKENWVGHGVLAMHAANRAEIKRSWKLLEQHMGMLQ